VMNGEHVMHEAARMVGGLHGAGYAPPSPDSPEEVSKDKVVIEAYLGFDKR